MDDMNINEIHLEEVEGNAEGDNWIRLNWKKNESSDNDKGSQTTEKVKASHRERTLDCRQSALFVFFITILFFYCNLYIQESDIEILEETKDKNIKKLCNTETEDDGISVISDSDEDKNYASQESQLRLIYSNLSQQLQNLGWLYRIPNNTQVLPSDYVLRILIFYII